MGHMGHIIWLWYSFEESLWEAVAANLGCVKHCFWEQQ
jgi:hypothetical protein